MSLVSRVEPFYRPPLVTIGKTTVPATRSSDVYRPPGSILYIAFFLLYFFYYCKRVQQYNVYIYWQTKNTLVYKH